MTEIFRLVAALGAVIVIVGMLSDAVATLIVTQGDSGLWRPTRLFYSATWRATKALAARLPDRSGDYVLNVYPALSLLVLWLAGLMIGWSLVYWGLDDLVARRGELRAGLAPAGRRRASPAGQGRGLGRPAGVAHDVRGRARAPDRLPRRAAGFWGHSPEETVADEVARAAGDARRKARGG